MAGHELRFGLFLGQRNDDWDPLLREFQFADELGFDYAWVFDHFIEHAHEAWTLLAGLAARTSRVRLGTMVTGNTYRNPALLLKQAVTVDHISNGRLVLGLGAGWHEGEHRMYGFPFPSARERVDRFGEVLEIITGLMGRETTTFEGRYYCVQDAHLKPKPVQQPRIPILIGTRGARMIRIAARHADIWDANRTPPDEAARLARQLDDACRAIGRDPSEIRRSILAGDEPLRSEGAFRDFVETYRPLGFTDFTCDLPGPEHHDTVRRIAAEVMPALRG